MGHARESSGRDTSTSERFDPRAPLHYAVKAVAGGAAEKGLDLVAEVGADLPDVWVSDAGRIERLLINLAGNAIKFSPSGRVTISASHEDGRLVYRVTDTGPGIEKAYRERIFEAFERGHPEVSGKTNGSGLGLSIARSSARLLGARLAVEDHPARNGATLALTLDPA